MSTVATATEIRPFHVDIADEALEDLRPFDPDDFAQALVRPDEVAA